MSDNSTSLLVVRVGPDADASGVEQLMTSVVDGRLIPVDSLSSVTDWASLKKVRRRGTLFPHVAYMKLQYYKLNADHVITKATDDVDDKFAVVDELVTSYIAMKSVMS